MKNYSNGLVTKEKIMETCKALFCEKGYMGTTYAEICEICQVNPGTITHHFKSKKNIASVLYHDMMALYYQKTEEMFPYEDDLQQVMVAAGMHQKLFYADPVYRRFSAEFLSDSTRQKDHYSDYTEHVTKAYRVTEEAVGPKMADFLFVAYKGMDSHLEPYLMAHIEELTFEEIFTSIAMIYYQFVNGEELRARIERAFACLDNTEIVFNNFDLTIRWAPYK